MSARALSRFRKIGPRGAWLLAEACLALIVASMMIAWLPFRRVAAALEARSARGRGAGENEGMVEQIRWAVEAAARRLPWRTVCFQKGVALHWMLRRRGFRSRLHYGVGNSEDQLRAHVWVSHGGKIVLGGEVAEQFACLATYPPEPTREGRR